MKTPEQLAAIALAKERGITIAAAAEDIRAGAKPAAVESPEAISETQDETPSVEVDAPPDDTAEV